MTTGFPPPPRIPDMRPNPRTGERNWLDFERWLVTLNDYLNKLITRVISASVDVINAADLIAEAEAAIAALDGRVTSAEANIATAQTDITALEAADATHVIGPASATDNAVARYDGTTGKLVQDSAVTIDDNGVLAGFRFGTHSAIGLELVTGYITITDAAGNARKLAVVS